MITFKTNMGDIVIELNYQAAPETCANFEQYVRDGHYDNTIFHRVINNFMIQGGGFMADMTQKPTRDPIKNEANNGLKNETGSIAMARTPEPHSASAQFFINVKNNDFLDYPGQDGWGYCVFGKVIEGMNIVNTMKTVETSHQSGHADVPVEPIVVESATMVKDAE